MQRRMLYHPDQKTLKQRRYECHKRLRAMRYAQYRKNAKTFAREKLSRVKEGIKRILRKKQAKKDYFIEIIGPTTKIKPKPLEGVKIKYELMPIKPPCYHKSSRL